MSLTGIEIELNRDTMDGTELFERSGLGDRNQPVIGPVRNQQAECAFPYKLESRRQACAELAHSSNLVPPQRESNRQIASKRLTEKVDRFASDPG